MARIIRKEVTLSDSISFTVPVDCTAIRVLSTASTTLASIAATSGGLAAGSVSAGADITLSTPCFGRDIVISGSGLTAVVVLLEVN